MSRKIGLLIAMVCGLGMGKAYTEVDTQTDTDTGIDTEYVYTDANAPHQAHVGEKPTKFYVGLVAGIERMTGRRTEGLREPAGLTIYQSNKRMLENKATISAVGGFLWKLPPLPVWMGAEGYFGRGNALSSVRDTRAAGANNRVYSTDFQRKFFYGGLVRVACEFCPNYFASFSLGIDRSQFLTKRTLTFDPAVSTTFVTRTKGFNGVLFGLGLEKHFDHFGVGLDLKMIQYRRQQPADPVAVPAGQGPATINFSIRPIIYSAALRLCYLF